MITREKVLRFLGGHCVRCLFWDYRVLEIHHTLGNGSQERKLMGSDSQRFYKTVLEDKSGCYSLLCSNCHRIEELRRRQREKILRNLWRPARKSNRLRRRIRMALEKRLV
jgi:hypothetical protein